MFLLVISGIAKLIKGARDGRQQIVGLIFAHDFFVLSGDSQQHSFAEAATAIDVVYFSQQALDEVLLQFPRLQSNILKQTLTNLEDARDRILLLGQKTATERVATFFFILFPKD